MSDGQAATITGTQGISAGGIRVARDRVPNLPALRPTRIQRLASKLGVHHLVGGGLLFLALVTVPFILTGNSEVPVYPRAATADFVEACARAAPEDVDYLVQARSCICIVSEYRKAGKSFDEFKASISAYLETRESDELASWIADACRARSGRGRV